MKKSLLLLLLIFFTAKIGAQSRSANSISGKVFDANARIPMEYSNIVLFNASDSSQVNGTITNKSGEFQISPVRPGVYYLRVSFIGYEDNFINQVNVGRGTKLDLGEIFLKPILYNTDDIVVKGDRAPISYQIDKKVINVSEQLTTISGNAVDVLENVPSVTVDIEGNVSLRGSSNFTVLIDGRPSILGGSEALQQIPATTIDNIEIITNPSAKYDPEGTAGIINVITKKNELRGMSGVTTLNGGLNDKYGGEFIFDYKTNDYVLNLGLDYNHRFFDMESKTENWTLFQNQKYFNNSSGSSNRGRDSYGVKASLSFDLSQNDMLTLSGRYGYRDDKNNSGLAYSEWNSLEADVLNYNSQNNRTRGGNYYGAGVSFTHKFALKGHEIAADFMYRNSKSDESTIYYQFDRNMSIVDGQKNTEAGPSRSLDIKLDYVLPINEDSKFEAGYNGELDYSQDVIGYFIYNPAISGFEYEDLFSKDSKYKDNNHALYSIYSNNFGSLGFQTGLRAEYTDREIKLTKTNESYLIDQWDYFPSIHLSYKVEGGNQFMTSYTRRIDRPHGWELEPFLTWMDTYNVRSGNPALKPEYIDSYEFSYQKLFEKSILSLEFYYRITNNKMEHIQSAYDENVTLRSVENVGKDYSFGSELMINFDPLDLWNINLMSNLYDYRIDGELNGRSFDRKSFNWNIRFNNSFKFTSSTQLQLNAFYNSPTVSAQGERKGFFMTNAAVRQDLFDKQLAITLQVRDLFGTSKREDISQSFDFYRFSEYLPESPMLMLNFRFNFNNYKSRERPNGENGMDAGGGEDF